jgi:acyl-CoA reductase-like NAD-dependent aldehyde dehydrogenase
LMLINKLAPALATGNTVVMKVSEKKHSPSLATSSSLMDSFRHPSHLS